ncbi:MAG: hypothetical protein AB1659_07270, partial [Thermodesulfobacteriota bacterium]
MTVNKNSGKSKNRYIEVAVPLPVHRSFVYETGEEFASLDLAGKRVIVPFGKRMIRGYVIGPGDPKESIDIKFIKEVLDSEPLFPESMIPFFRWIAEYYIYPMGETIRCILPSGLDGITIEGFRITGKGKRALSENCLPEFQKQVLQQLGNGTHRLKTIEVKLGKKI